MNLRNAIIETYTERFGHDKPYLQGKLDKLDECNNTQDLLYFCMNIDSEGLEKIGQKLDFPNFDNFVFTFRNLDQKF